MCVCIKVHGLDSLKSMRSLAALANDSPRFRQRVRHGASDGKDRPRFEEKIAILLSRESCTALKLILPLGASRIVARPRGDILPRSHTTAGGRIKRIYM